MITILESFHLGLGLLSLLELWGRYRGGSEWEKENRKEWVSSLRFSFRWPIEKPTVHSKGAKSLSLVCTVWRHSMSQSISLGPWSQSVAVGIMRIWSHSVSESLYLLTMLSHVPVCWVHHQSSGVFSLWQAQIARETCSNWLRWGSPQIFSHYSQNRAQKNVWIEKRKCHPEKSIHLRKSEAYRGCFQPF